MSQKVKFYRYSWGWDFGPILGWWLVWSRCSGRLRIYVSDDATPPDNERVRGFFIR